MNSLDDGASKERMLIKQYPGVAIAEICLGGLGQVQLIGDPTGGAATGLNWLQVRSSRPVHACLASQYAGWSLAATKEETGGKKFFSLGSGPARALAGKEELFKELGYSDPIAADQRRGVLVLEVDRVPPPVIVDKLLRDCGLAAEGLTLILTPTRSLAGTTQVVARVLEVALHKSHELGYDLGHIVDGAFGFIVGTGDPGGGVAASLVDQVRMHARRFRPETCRDLCGQIDALLRLPERIGAGMAAFLGGRLGRLRQRCRRKAEHQGKGNQVRRKHGLGFNLQGVRNSTLHILDGGRRRARLRPPGRVSRDGRGRPQRPRLRGARPGRRQQRTISIYVTTPKPPQRRFHRGQAQCHETL